MLLLQVLMPLKQVKQLLSQQQNPILHSFQALQLSLVRLMVRWHAHQRVVLKSWLTALVRVMVCITSIPMHLVLPIKFIVI